MNTSASTQVSTILPAKQGRIVDLSPFIQLTDCDTYASLVKSIDDIVYFVAHSARNKVSKIELENMLFSLRQVRDALAESTRLTEKHMLNQEIERLDKLAKEQALEISYLRLKLSSQPEKATSSSKAGPPA